MSLKDVNIHNVHDSEHVVQHVGPRHVKVHLRKIKAAVRNLSLRIGMYVECSGDLRKSNKNLGHIHGSELLRRAEQ